MSGDINKEHHSDALGEASDRRQDDLREFIKQLFDRELVALRRELETFARHQRELDKAESARLDSIRQVDREDVNKTAAQTLAAVQTLARETTTMADTLRAQREHDSSEISKRISALELTSSEGKGKQAVVDPQLAELLVEMKHMRGTKIDGINLVWGVILAVLGVGGMLFGLLKS